MNGFSARKILRTAYWYTLKHPWLWVFGIFASGSEYIGLEALDQSFGQVDLAGWSQQQISGMPEKAAGFILLVLLVAAVILIIQTISRSAILWSVGEKVILQERRREGADISARQEVNFRTALRAGLRSFLPVLGVQFAVMAGMFVLMALYLWPVSFLWSAGATARGIVLAVLGLLIFVPAVLVLALLYAIAPVFIVVLRRKMVQAVSLSFSLLRKKFIECLLLGLMLFVIGLLLILLVGSSIILFSSLIGQAQTGQLLSPGLAGLLLFVASAVWTVLLQSIFSVFYSSAWAVAVLKLAGTINAAEREEEYIAEPAA